MTFPKMSDKILTIYTSPSANCLPVLKKRRMSLDPKLVFSRTAKNSYSFFNSMAGLVRVALRVCQRTVPKAMAREMSVATMNTQP